ncbi:hypothetical protein EMPG_11528 [Blastomyces silverae]|uniref:Uncharacterized protein n=1 Tax=Blastomyces silverae TaxID=2060906 RepID=A0A0H1BPR9_9EURO|nr:hypothetical protein EMPG_11528 [Blastomyces silverae]
MNEVRCGMYGMIFGIANVSHNAFSEATCHLAIRNDLIHGTKRLNRKIGKFVYDSCIRSGRLQQRSPARQPASKTRKFRGFPSSALKMCLPDMINARSRTRLGCNPKTTRLMQRPYSIELVNSVAELRSICRKLLQQIPLHEVSPQKASPTPWLRSSIQPKTRAQSCSNVVVHDRIFQIPFHLQRTRTDVVNK